MSIISDKCERPKSENIAAKGERINAGMIAEDYAGQIRDTGASLMVNNGVPGTTEKSAVEFEKQR